MYLNVLMKQLVPNGLDFTPVHMVHMLENWRNNSAGCVLTEFTE